MDDENDTVRLELLRVSVQYLGSGKNALTSVQEPGEPNRPWIAESRASY